MAGTSPVGCELWQPIGSPKLNSCHRSRHHIEVHFGQRRTGPVSAREVDRLSDSPGRSRQDILIQPGNYGTERFLPSHSTRNYSSEMHQNIIAPDMLDPK